MTTIIDKLNRLADLRSAPDAIALQKQDLIASILTPEQRQAIEDINVEFALKLQLAAEQASALEEEIKQDVIAAGCTIKSDHLTAVWNKPRVTWDGSKLEGMMSLIPQLKDARKEGAPTCTIRKI